MQMLSREDIGVAFSRLIGNSYSVNPTAFNVPILPPSLIVSDIEGQIGKPVFFPTSLNSIVWDSFVNVYVVPFQFFGTIIGIGNNEDFNNAAIDNWALSTSANCRYLHNQGFQSNATIMSAGVRNLFGDQFYLGKANAVTYYWFPVGTTISCSGGAPSIIYQWPGQLSLLRRWTPWDTYPFASVGSSVCFVSGSYYYGTVVTDSIVVRNSVNISFSRPLESHYLGSVLGNSNVSTYTDGTNCSRNGGRVPMCFNALHFAGVTGNQFQPGFSVQFVGYELAPQKNAFGTNSGQISIVDL